MSINVEAKNVPNIIQFRLYLTKLLQKQNSSTFLWFTAYYSTVDTNIENISQLLVYYYW